MTQETDSEGNPVSGLLESQPRGFPSVFLPLELGFGDDMEGPRFTDKFPLVETKEVFDSHYAAGLTCHRMKTWQHWLHLFVLLVFCAISIAQEYMEIKKLQRWVML